MTETSRDIVLICGLNEVSDRAFSEFLSENSLRQIRLQSLEAEWKTG